MEALACLQVMNKIRNHGSLISKVKLIILFFWFLLASQGTSGVSFSPSLVAGGEWNEPQFFCQCPSGTFGSRCERGRWCKNSEQTSQQNGISGDPTLNVDGDGAICKHHGECEDGPSAPICWCIGGYTGATCQLDIVLKYKKINI